VRSMQKRLIDLGYLLGTPTGRFDPATEAAIIAFQDRNMSYSDGIAGPQTLQKLYSSSARGTSTPQGVVGTSLQRGMTDSAAVRLVQARLRDLHYYSGGIDGDFGATTEAAVKAFQSANGLTPDGRVGSGTYSRLFGTDTGNNTQTPTPRPGTTPTPTRIPVYVNVTPNPQGEYVTLREGNSGTLVRALQDALRKQGYFTLTVDGLYGFGTSDAVRNFQRYRGLTQDGIAGPATQRILYEGNNPDGS
jgi:peptidoglycan hydrolase-like protein with peptidoglycan-binding domain